jgi:hypothetical protein
MSPRGPKEDQISNMNNEINNKDNIQSRGNN